jgi:predicted phosphoadenosine phosphosulfate sulfurtransferase
MVLIQKDLDIDVVTAARDRIVNIFGNGIPVHLSLSGGKDSICLAGLTFDLITEGLIDPKQLTVHFIDEEAIFDDVEEITREWRIKFMSVGVKFHWWCVEVKHFNCFNQLSNDETFICWDRTMADRWVRPMPDFAQTTHPMLRPRKETYQAFLKRITGDGINMIGLRTAESVQRLYAVSKRGINDADKSYPIFDWKDPDVWRYIRDKNLNFPKTYMNFYQLGYSRRDMRISQFFSVDTSRNLVRLSEFYPDLMDRIVKREPNAYLASLYWDSEMFRRSGGQKKIKQQANDEDIVEIDYGAKVKEFISNPANLDSEVRIKNIMAVRSMMIRFNDRDFLPKDWKMIYNLLVAGDPKARTLRAVALSVHTNNWENLKNDEASQAL